MKVISDKTLKNGTRRLVVDLSANEQIQAFNEDRFYKLGGQINDVHRGHVFNETSEVYWDGFSQEWQS
jgi:hypothetical protein